MRFFVPFLLLLHTSLFSGVPAQSVNFEDGFEDGNFTANPAWSGDSDQFTITSGANYLLQLNSSTTDPAYLSTQSNDTLGVWEFYVEFDGFEPSGSNRAEVFLMSDISDLEGAVNGYAVQAGQTGDDVFKLVRYDNGSQAATVLTDTTIVSSSGGGYRVRVTRSAGGTWEIEVGKGYTGTLYHSGNTATDNTYYSASYFGVRVNFTSTRSDKFLFDFKIDLPPFSVVDAVADGNEIDVTFNEAYDPSTVQISDFTVDHGLDSPSALDFRAADIVRLIYPSPLPGNEYILTIGDLNDVHGQDLTDNTASFVVFDEYSPGDVIINEFVYDPPSGGVEYVELKNISAKYLNIKSWKLGDERALNTISYENQQLGPGQYLVISADTVSLHNTFGHRPYIQMGTFPSLNNTGDAVRIATEDGVIVDSLSYSPNWGGANVALERRSDSVSPAYPENWADSPNILGGTPGLENEVPEDQIPPTLVDMQITDSQNILLTFDERLDGNSASDVLHYSLADGPDIASATVTAADSVSLTLPSPLLNATEYTLSVNGVMDIFGNSIIAADTTFTYYEISVADSGDVFVNEFMYDPPDGSSEYVEIYNPSEKSLDLQGWTLNDNTGSKREISSSRYILPPESRVVIAPDNTLLTLFPEISVLTLGSSFPVLNNGGDSIVLRNSEGQLLDSLTYTSGWNGEGVALERRTTTVSGTYPSNWGEAPNGFGTPGTANDVEPDASPPGVLSLEILAETSLRLTFDEPLDSGTSTDPSNYRLSNGITIGQATALTESKVELLLSSGLQNATSYSLSLQGVADIFGNGIVGLDSTFTYYKISDPDSGDVFITEFMYDPPDGESEYVELYNISHKSLDLKGWTINDNTGKRRPITKESSIVPPLSFVVLAPDETLLKSDPETPLIVMGNQFPALNNSGDDIVIRNPNGVLLDSLRYTSDWGGLGNALERRTTTLSGTYRENWGDAPNGTGTPGRTNNIPPDETAPTFDQLTVLNERLLQLKFSERLKPESAGVQSNYTIDPARKLDSISISDDTVFIALSEPLQSGHSYRVTADQLGDIFGNTMSATTREISFIKFSPARPGDIVINEILFTRKDGSDPEFVELYNTSDRNIDLSDWRLGDAAGEVPLKEQIRIMAGDFLVLTDNSAFADSLKGVEYLSGFPSLNDAGDAVYIRTPQGQTIDSLYYRSHWSPAEKGFSIERRDPLAASNDPSNWQAHAGISGYSAGKQNASYQPDESPPQVVFAKILPDGAVEVRFNEFVNMTENPTFLLGKQPLEIKSFSPDRGNRVALQFPKSKSQTDRSSSALTVRNLTDVRGNITQSAEIPISHPLEPGSIVINEIMFNPLNASDDNLPDQSEYVEVRNTNDFAVSLEGVVLHDAPDENEEVRVLVPVSTSAKWIPPRGVALIYADDAPDFKQSKVAGFFEIASKNTSTTMRIDRNTLSLASGTDAVYLTDSTGTVIDSVHYNESWHNPNLIDTRGVALERINPTAASNDPANWGSSTHEKGGTPFAENTLYQEPDGTPQQTGISFSPNPFSPDDDGFDDNLLISYKLDQADYLMKVRIYDRYGRLIRRLADGQPTGFEGTLIWDGRRDDGTRNRIGIYIVVFEAFNSANGKSRAFKETVVLARRLN